MIISKARLIALSCIALGGASAPLAPALAGEQAKSPPGLPGVEGGYSIVKPVPEPGAPAEDSTKIGNFDVRVSGFVRAEVGFGNEMEIRRPK